MFKAGDKVYFIKRLSYNLSLSYDKELTVGLIIENRHNIIRGYPSNTTIRILDTIGGDYYEQQFISSNDYFNLKRKEKLKKLKYIQRNNGKCLNIMIKYILLKVYGTI